MTIEELVNTMISKVNSLIERLDRGENKQEYKNSIYVKKARKIRTADYESTDMEVLVSYRTDEDEGEILEGMKKYVNEFIDNWELEERSKIPQPKEKEDQVKKPQGGKGGYYRYGGGK